MNGFKRPGFTVVGEEPSAFPVANELGKRTQQLQSAPVKLAQEQGPTAMGPGGKPMEQANKSAGNFGVGGA